jgi:hypothetical protein
MTFTNEQLQLIFRAVGHYKSTYTTGGGPEFTRCQKLLVELSNEVYPPTQLNYK